MSDDFQMINCSLPLHHCPRLDWRQMSTAEKHNENKSIVIHREDNQIGAFFPIYGQKISFSYK